METANLVMKASSSSFFSNSICSFIPTNPRPSASRQGIPHHQASFIANVKCINPSSKDHKNSVFHPKPTKKFLSLSCSGLTSSFSDSSSSTTKVKVKLQFLVAEFQSLQQPLDRVKRLLNYASACPSMEESLKKPENRVLGCTAQVWLKVGLDEGGRMRFAADSDSEITKGFCACLVSVLDGASPEEVLEVKIEDLAALNVVGVNSKTGSISTASRVNTWHNVLVSMQKRTKALVDE